VWSRWELEPLSCLRDITCKYVCFILHCLRKEADMFLLFILGDDAAVKNQPAWKVLVMVVSIYNVNSCLCYFLDCNIHFHVLEKT